jgi:TrpR family trp operon transcriptional repressor
MGNDEGWQLFLTLCMKMNSKQDFDRLFRVLLTSEEHVDLAGRALIVKELLRGELSQRAMSEQLNVSIAKITRGSNELKRADTPLKVFLKDNFNEG